MEKEKEKIERKKIAYLFLNGELEGRKEFFKTYIEREPGDIYCADGGYRHCETLGVQPCEIWGDMDSIKLSQLEKLEREGIVLKKFPKDKDFTDGELILEYLYSQEYERIQIIGGLGGERAHELTNLSLTLKYDNLVFLTEREILFSVRDYTIIRGQKGSIISFVPMSDIVENLTLKGFKYPLNSYHLQKGQSICMSNRIEENECVVNFQKGVLLGILKIK